MTKKDIEIIEEAIQTALMDKELPVDTVEWVKNLVIKKLLINALFEQEKIIDTFDKD